MTRSKFTFYILCTALRYHSLPDLVSQLNEMHHWQYIVSKQCDRLKKKRFLLHQRLLGLLLTGGMWWPKGCCLWEYQGLQRSSSRFIPVYLLSAATRGSVTERCMLVLWTGTNISVIDQLYTLLVNNWLNCVVTNYCSALLHMRTRHFEHVIIMKCSWMIVV